MHNRLVVCSVLFSYIIRNKAARLLCVVSTQISLASKNRTPIRHESAPLSLSLVTGITIFFFFYGEMF